MRVFVNGMLWRIPGTKRGEVVQDWKRLQNKELHNLDCSTNNFVWKT
jgi:hypothetical protein